MLLYVLRCYKSPYIILSNMSHQMKPEPGSLSSFLWFCDPDKLLFYKFHCYLAGKRGLYDLDIRCWKQLEEFVLCFSIRALANSGSWWVSFPELILQHQCPLDTLGHRVSSGLSTKPIDYLRHNCPGPWAGSPSLLSQPLAVKIMWSGSSPQWRLPRSVAEGISAISASTVSSCRGSPKSMPELSIWPPCLFSLG